MKARKITGFILAALMLLSLIPMATVSASAELPQVTINGLIYETVTFYDPGDPVVPPTMPPMATYKDNVGTEIAASGKIATEADGVLIDLKWVGASDVNFNLSLSDQKFVPTYYATECFYSGANGYTKVEKDSTTNAFGFTETDWEGTVFIPKSAFPTWDNATFAAVSVKFSCSEGEITWDNIRLAYVYCDHEWKDGDVIKEATHTEEGLQYISCDKCQSVKTKTLSKLPEHDFGRWSRVDNNQHKKSCKCGEEIFEDHTWDEEGYVWTAATHFKTGVLRRECTANGCNATKDEEIPKLTEHEWEYSKVDANEHKVTCDCGEEKTEAHVWDAGVVTVEPTADAEGVKTFTCVCGETKTEAIAKLETDAEDEGGCGSVVGGGFAMMAILSGAAVMLTKKRRK